MYTTPIKLTGSDKEKINQILQLIKDRQLTPEQYEMLLPQCKGFLDNLNQAMNKEIELGHIEYQEFQKQTQKYIELLITDKESSERVQIEKIHLADKMHERNIQLQDNRDKRRNGFKKFLSILGTILLFFWQLLLREL